jgi:hypothetical protein
MKFSKAGVTFVHPNILMKPDIIIPPNRVKDIVSPPDEVLSCRKGLDDNMQADYTLLDARIVSNQWHTLPVKALSALTSRHIDKIMEEVSCGLDAYFGMSSSWHEIKVHDVMSKLVTRAANRFVVGDSVCMYCPLFLCAYLELVNKTNYYVKGRNEEFVASATNFGVQSLMVAMVIRTLPESLKP